MPAATITTATVWEDADCVLMARVLGNDGAAITQSITTTVKVKMYDIVSAPTTDTISNRSLTVSAVVYDTLQTTTDDARWTVDTTGYNFLYALPAADISTPTVYRVEITFTPTSGGAFPLVYQITAQGLLGS